MFTYRVDDDITLELLAHKHKDALFHLLDTNRDFIGKYQSWVMRFKTSDDMPRYMSRDLEGLADGSHIGCVIHYQGEMVGQTGIWISNAAIGECEIHYWLAEKFTGKGIITRVTHTLVDYAFAELALRRVVIGFEDANIKSKAIPERLGFREDGRMRHDEMRAGKWIDLHFLSILRDEWDVSTHPVFARSIDDHLELRLQQLHYVQQQYGIVQKNLEEFKNRFLFAQDYSLKKEEDYTRAMLQRYADDAGMMLGIWYDNTLVGSLSLRIDKDDNKGGIGYFLDADYRGKGLMTRSVQTVIDYCFRERKVRRVELEAAVDNVASRRVAEKVGMTYEGVFRQNQFLNGRFIDHAQYGILADEYFNSEKD